MAFLHPTGDHLKLLSIGGVCARPCACQRITLVCMMGCVALPSMGVVPRKLPGPPESLVDTLNNGLVSFPHLHLYRALGTASSLLGLQTW